MTRESKSQHGVIVVKPSAALGPILVQEPTLGFGRGSEPETVNLAWLRTGRVVAFVLVAGSSMQLPAMVHDQPTRFRENHVDLLGPPRRPEPRGIVPAVGGVIAREHRCVGEKYWHPFQ